MSVNIETFTDQNWEQGGPRLRQAGARGLLGGVVQALPGHGPRPGGGGRALRGRLKVGKLNVEENDDVPFRYNITGDADPDPPEGRQGAEQRVGKMSKDALVKLVEPHLS